jgi:hypothetical protein
MGPRGDAEMDQARCLPWDGPSTVYCVAEPYCPPRMACIDLRSKAYRVGATNLRHPAVVKGAPRSDVNTNGDGGSWSRLSRRRARSSTPLNGWTDGAPFLARLTWIWPSTAGSKVRRRNRPCLGRPRSRALLGPHQFERPAAGNDPGDDGAGLHRFRAAAPDIRIGGRTA